MITKPYLFLAFLVLLRLIASACAPAVPATDENVPSQQTAPTEPYYSLGTQTGIQIIDGLKGIVRVDTIFDSLPANLNAMLEREASTVILPPKP
jgi:hypothetical protein